MDSVYIILDNVPKLCFLAKTSPSSLLLKVIDGCPIEIVLHDWLLHVLADIVLACDVNKSNGSAFCKSVNNISGDSIVSIEQLLSISVENNNSFSLGTEITEILSVLESQLIL